MVHMPRYLTGFLLVVVTSVFLSSCVIYGPDAERKSALDLLSEKNYQETASVLGVSIIKSKKRNTVIKGAVYIDDIIPLKFKKLRLLNSRGETVSETTTSYNGVFEFKDYIINGKYLIEIDSAKYCGETKIKVADYQLNNIIIKARPSQPLCNEPG
jgi:hypothetical protein